MLAGLLDPGMRRGSHGFDDGIGHFSVTVQRGEHVAEHLY